MSVAGHVARPSGRLRPRWESVDRKPGRLIWWGAGLSTGSFAPGKPMECCVSDHIPREKEGREEKERERRGREWRQRRLWSLGCVGAGRWERCRLFGLLGRWSCPVSISSPHVRRKWVKRPQADNWHTVFFLSFSDALSHSGNVFLHATAFESWICFMIWCDFIQQGLVFYWFRGCKL